LKKEYKDVETSIAPKKKFAFSNRSKISSSETTISLPATQSKITNDVITAKSSDLLPPGSHVIQDRSSEDVIQLVSPGGFDSPPQIFLKNNRVCKIAL
jgi:hypothetical protein